MTINKEVRIGEPTDTFCKKVKRCGMAGVDSIYCSRSGCMVTYLPKEGEVVIADFNCRFHTKEFIKEEATEDQMVLMILRSKDEALRSFLKDVIESKTLKGGTHAFMQNAGTD